MMLTTAKPRQVPYSQVSQTPLTISEEKKLEPFRAYRSFLLKVAAIFAFTGILVLGFVVVGHNIHFKKIKTQRIQHFPVHDENFNEHYNKFKQFMYQ